MTKYLKNSAKLSSKHQEKTVRIHSLAFIKSKDHLTKYWLK